jgi:hypothetical protein
MVEQHFVKDSLAIVDYIEDVYVHPPPMRQHAYILTRASQ